MVNQLDQRMVQIRERIDTTQSMLAGGTDDYWS